MRVKCIKTAITVSNKKIINNDISSYMVIGTIFLVYGLRFSLNVTYVYIYDGDHLLEVPLELFEIIDENVSVFWKVKTENGEVTLWPELFSEDEFLENFSEREERERNIFDTFKVKF